MEIKLKNIAKIMEADIDMNGISIIAGNNNIGSTLQHFIVLNPKVENPTEVCIRKDI